MTNIGELPIEVLIDGLLPALPLRDLLALGCTSKFFAAVCSDDTFWKRKTQSEYNFSGADSARTSGFKHVYRGLRSPRVFVWGESSHNRLALTKRKHPTEADRWEDISYPVELDLKHRIVHIAAGGWSFHALTDDGRVLVWGTLDAEGDGWGSDFLYSRASAEEPVALSLPQRIKSLSVGRRHAVLLDAHKDVWIVRTWGRPARLVTPALDNAQPESSVAQVEAGWDVCAFLTDAGQVFVVFPFHGLFDAEERSALGEGPQAVAAEPEITAQDGEVQCRPRDIQHHPTRLPALPANLPTLHRPTDATAQEAAPRLVKIAAGEGFIVGLTNGGHVLKLDLPTHNEAELRQIIERGNLQWNYLPRFCDVAHVRNESGFKQQQGQEEQSALEDLTVTHISAQFRTFVVYSTIGSSVVLLGKSDTTAQGSPTIVPELQNRNVISVVLGDYHYCALTAGGELFSWGKYSAGALGLGSPRRSRGPPHMRRFMALPRQEEKDADVPTRVGFDHEDGVQNRYVFAVAAAGWHCGALVIDLHSTSSTSGESSTERPEAQPVRELQTDSDTGASTSQPIAQLPRRTEGSGGTQPPQITLPIVRGRGGAPFARIGYAARGAYAGRGRGFSASNSGSGAGDGGNPGRAEL